MKFLSQKVKNFDWCLTTQKLLGKLQHFWGGSRKTREMCVCDCGVRARQSRRSGNQGCHVGRQRIPCQCWKLVVGTLSRSRRQSFLRKSSKINLSYTRELKTREKSQLNASSHIVSLLLSLIVAPGKANSRCYLWVRWSSLSNNCV